MSSHHSQKWFNLHHDQVNAGQAKRQQCQEERTWDFLEKRNEARWEHWCVLTFGFICFSYIMLATSVYLGYVIC